MQRSRTGSYPGLVAVPDPGETAMKSVGWRRVGVFGRLVKQEAKTASPAADVRPVWVRRAA